MLCVRVRVICVLLLLFLLLLFLFAMSVMNAKINVIIVRQEIEINND